MSEYVEGLPGAGTPRWWDHRQTKWQESQAFVEKHHKHSEPLKRHKFSIGMYDYSTRNWDLIGVVTADNCSSAWSKYYDHAEIHKLCVLPDNPNLCVQTPATCDRCLCSHGDEEDSQLYKTA